jgi:octaprenyl-diphosphate synthase
LRHYGLEIGTAYQVYDDCLDLFGTEAAAGKSLGTDLAKGKLTLPIIWLMERAQSDEQKKIRSWLENWKPESFPNLMQLLETHGALDESQAAVQQHLTAARQHLISLPDSSSRTGLAGITEYLTQQVARLRSPS